MNVKKRLLISTMTSGNFFLIPLVIAMSVLCITILFIVIDTEYYTIGTNEQRISIHEKRFIGPRQNLEEISTFESITYIQNKINEKLYANNDINNRYAKQPQKITIEIFDENQSEIYYVNTITLSSFVAMIGVLLFLMLMPAMLVHVHILRPYRQIISASNMEKRAKALQKIGIPEFIKSTKSVLIDSSSRGNSLYESKNIIDGRQTRFLVYKDISTDRMYIKYVPIIDRKTGNVLNTADKAQAWSLSMSLERYQKMTIEA